MPPNRQLLDHVLVPVAHETDARETARALAPYEPAHVTALHVVERRNHFPAKLPVEQAEAVAAESFAAVRAVFPDADVRTAYSADVVGAIFDAVDEDDATAVAYRSRGGGRVRQFLSGDRSLELVTQATRPVIALPRTEPHD